MRKKSTIGILGLGLFGTSVARTLAESDIDVIAMDRNMDHVETLRMTLASLCKAISQKLIS